MRHILKKLCYREASFLINNGSVQIAFLLRQQNLPLIQS